MNSEVCFDEKDCSDSLGMLSYNKRDYTKKSAPRQAANKWIIAIGKHKGRVTGEKCAAVQRIIEENIPTGKKPAKMHNDYSLLSGFIYCEKCGSRMFAKRRAGHTANPDAYDYICSNKMRGGTSLCDLNGQQVDDMVCEYLMSYTNESSDIYLLLEKLKKDLQGQKKEDPIQTLTQKSKNAATK